MIKSQGLCIQLRPEKIGPLGKNLENVIDNQGIKGQAYHGFSFVRNHCKIQIFVRILTVHIDQKNSHEITINGFPNRKINEIKRVCHS